MSDCMWLVCETVDGYNLSDNPPLAGFDDYEKAVEYLYKDNKNNSRKLCIENI